MDFDSKTVSHSLVKCFQYYFLHFFYFKYEFDYCFYFVNFAVTFEEHDL